MKMVTLINPSTGANISSVYCEKGKEIYKEATERNEGLEVKVNKVTNAEPFVLKVGERISVPEHQAAWALHIWEFLEIDGTMKEEPVSEPATEIKSEDAKEMVGEPQDPADRFADLQIKGFRNLKGAERDEYIKLKNMLK